MTSTVAARDRGAARRRSSGALFPAASITGAPKVAHHADHRRAGDDAARHLHRLRRACSARARRGWSTWRSGRSSSTAARGRPSTASAAASSGTRARGGRVRASAATKTLVLGAPPPPFRLIETLPWTPGGGLLPARAAPARGWRESAAYFGFACDRGAARAARRGDARACLRTACGCSRRARRDRGRRAPLGRAR